MAEHVSKCSSLAFGILILGPATNSDLIPFITGCGRTVEPSVSLVVTFGFEYCKLLLLLSTRSVVLQLSWFVNLFLEAICALTYHFALLSEPSWSPG